jgi:signal transduction histidine kinase
MDPLRPPMNRRVASSTRLHLRVAVATAVVLGLLGTVMFMYVRNKEVGQAEANLTNHARYVELSILRDELTPSDLRAPVHTAAELRRLDWLFKARVLVLGALRVKLYRSPDGLVTYSNDHGLIGTTSDNHAEFVSVLNGRVKHDASNLNEEGGSGRNVKTLSVYVPLTLRGAPRPGGVLELYQSYAPVKKAVNAVVAPFAAIVGLALLCLWIGLFPLIQRMARALDRARAGRHSAERALEETSEQLRQSQKMEAIGSLAGSVAHDFNNLLLAINGYSEFLSESLTDPRQQRFAQEIHNAGERAAALTQQLLAFSRRQVLEPKVINLNDSVVELESMLRRLIGEGVAVHLDLDPALKRVRADPSQMGQVVLNLAVNARDAMGGQGALTIASRNHGDVVVLEVSDTGTGMDDETAERIFEPFFTTKGVGAGTGLGLSTVYGIVAQSGGSIDVRTAPGAGATFTVRLPATSAEADGDGRVDGRPANGGERILVVDDDPVVLDLLGQMLTGQGYEVTVCASGPEALALDRDWDLLLTDVVLPGLDGVELSHRIRARHVLFMSGYDQHALARTGAPLLQKPFGRDDLARAVREQLDVPAPAAA